MMEAFPLRADIHIPAVLLYECTIKPIKHSPPPLHLFPPQPQALYL